MRIFCQKPAHPGGDRAEIGPEVFFFQILGPEISEILIPETSQPRTTSSLWKPRAGSFGKS